MLRSPSRNVGQLSARDLLEMAIVADTHAIIWYLVEPERLSQVALDTLEGAMAAGESVYISAISLIEICYLIEKRRIASDLLQRILDEIVTDAAVTLAEFRSGITLGFLSPLFTAQAVRVG